MLELIVLVLTVQWLLSFFGGTTFLPRILHSGGFIYLLSVLIFSLIAARFLSLL